MLGALTEEAKSGKCAIYAQWMAVLALVSLVGIPFLVLLSPSLWIWCVVSWVVAVVVLLLEFPLLSFLYRSGSIADNLMTYTRKPMFRGPAYLVYAAIVMNI